MKKKCSILLIFVSLLIGCESTRNLISNEIVYKNDTWSIHVQEMNEGPDSFWKNHFQNYIVVRPDDSTLARELSKAGVASPRYAPRYSNNGYIWVLLAVVNKDDAKHSFDFSRVRLVSSKYVINPEIVDYSPLENPIFMDKKKLIQEIKPKGIIYAKLVFEHTKGSLPFQLVYDNQIAGKIYDRIVISSSELQKNK